MNPTWEDILGAQVRLDLERAERTWRRLLSPGTTAMTPVGLGASGRLGDTDWDVVVAGGTLGIAIAATLARRGHRVALVERGSLRGRDQEWNVSSGDLDVLVRLGLLEGEEIERVIATHCGPGRVAFGRSEFWVEGVLDVGVDPVYLLAVLKRRFLDAGGTLFEECAFKRAYFHLDGVRVDLQNGQSLTCRLLIDAMGYSSPLALQARRDERPESACLVVGSCATGYHDMGRGGSDLLVSFTPIQNQCQYLWEAFPARDGGTTYLFTYQGTEPGRIGFEVLLGEYLRLLPTYQAVPLDALHFRRVLFGLFPSYRSPLDFRRVGWDRVLAVGDSAGNQSPLSFGGFGAMLRHIERLEAGIDEALNADCLGATDLGLLQPYQPNLAVTRLFQKAMSVRADEKANPDQVNRLLAVVFECMKGLGDGVIRPFLQDVVRRDALVSTLARVALREPALVLGIARRLGPLELVDWSGHFLNLVGYDLLFHLARPLEGQLTRLPQQTGFRVRRWLDAWEYGSGNDWHPD